MSRLQNAGKSKAFDETDGWKLVIKALMVISVSKKANLALKRKGISPTKQAPT
jgi:hypothetical protein